MRPVLVELRLECTIAWLGVALLAGCASAPPGKPEPRKDLFAFLTDGRTNCAEVIGRLGDPSQRYEGGQLLTYRVTGDSASGYSVVAATTWEGANYSLVIQCTAEGIVMAHTLVAVKGR